VGLERTVVQLVVPFAEAELAADALWQAEPSAVLEVDVGDGHVRLTADVTDPVRIPGPWVPSVLAVDDDGYLDAWRTWAVPVRVGRRLVVHPAWLARADDADADVVVVVDPGRAFGSGSHPSTRLALAALEDLVGPGTSVLDVGCGSGVLAVAACLLGAAEANAVDVEPAAVRATGANAAANGVADRVRASTSAVEDVDGTYDVVVANISAAALTAMAAALEDRVPPAGALILAGMLDEQADAVVAACRRSREVGRSSEDGWAAVVLRPVG